MKVRLSGLKFWMNEVDMFLRKLPFLCLEIPLDFIAHKWLVPRDVRKGFIVLDGSLDGSRSKTCFADTVEQAIEIIEKVDRVWFARLKSHIKRIANNHLIREPVDYSFRLRMCRLDIRKFELRLRQKEAVIISIAAGLVFTVTQAYLARKRVPFSRSTYQDIFQISKRATRRFITRMGCACQVRECVEHILFEEFQTEGLGDFYLKELRELYNHFKS